MSDPTLEQLIARLSHSDYAARRRAAEDLIARGEAAVPALIGAVEGRSLLACVRAIDALGRLHALEALPTFRDLLETEHDQVVLVEVVGALHRIREAHPSDFGVRTLIMAILAAHDGRVALAKANRRMSTALTSEELLARYQEQQRLATRTTHQEPLPVGSGTLQRSVPSEISALLQALRDPDYNRGKVVVQRLVELGEAAVEPLITADLSPLAQQRAARALGKIGDPRAVGYLILRYRWAINENTNGDFDLTGAVSAGLEELAANLATNPPPERLPTLLTLIRELRFIHQAAAVAAAQGLVYLAANHPSPELRQALALLKGGFLSPVPSAFGRIRKEIEKATAPWKDLPLIAEAPTASENLPRPVGGKPDA